MIDYQIGYVNRVGATGTSQVTFYRGSVVDGEWVISETLATVEIVCQCGCPENVAQPCPDLLSMIQQRIAADYPGEQVRT